MHRRSALVAFALLPLLAACPSEKHEATSGPASSGAAPASAKKVKLALNWVPEPEFGGFYAARENGAYKKENLEVEIQGGGAGVPVMQMVATGQADFAIAGADEILGARARGADVVPVFAVYQKSPQGIMAHASRGAKNVGDLLKDGTLAIEPGLPYANFLKKKYGDLKAKVVPYDGGFARFLVEKDFAQQCYVTSEPLAAKKKGSDPQVFLIADEGFNPYIGVVVASAKVWKQSPDVVKAFVRATREGWKSYLADPKPANAVMGKLNASMDAETFQAAADAQKPLVESDDTKAKGLGAMTKERWETLAKQLNELGVLEKTPAIDFLPALD